MKEVEFVSLIILVVGLAAIAFMAIHEHIKAKKKTATLRTKLLKKLRREANNRVGVFLTDDYSYEVVYSKYVADVVSDYKRGSYRFDVLDTFRTEEKAVESCDYYRRKFILQVLRDKKFGNSDRIY